MAIMDYCIRVTADELPVMLYACNTRGLYGIADLLEEKEEERTQISDEAAIASLMDKGYFQQYGKAKRATPVVQLLVGPCKEAERVVRLSRMVKDGEQTATYFGINNARMLLKNKDTYTFLLAEEFEEAVGIFRYLLMLDKQVPAYQGKGILRAKSFFLQVWQASFDMGNANRAYENLIESGLPLDWARHMHYTLSNPLFRGKMTVYDRVPGKIHEESWNLLLGTDGIAYSFENTGKETLIEVLSVAQIMERIQGAMKTPRNKTQPEAAV